MSNDGTAWQVIIVEPCLSWLHELRRSDRLSLIQISQAITVLAEEGPGLGRPLVDTVSGSKLANLKELWPGSTGDSEVRLYWNDLVEEFDFSPDEKREIREGADHMIAEVRARRLAEVRKRHKATQVEVAAAMGVSQARVSRIEKGQLEKSEVETLAAYVKALGGKLKIIADFGDESYVLG